MRLSVLFSVLMCLVVFSGCAVKETVKNVSDEDRLRERVMAYWDHNIKEEFDKSYDFEYPLYQKAIKRIDYIKGISNNIKWLKVTIEKIEIEGDTAKVTNRLDTKFEGMPAAGVAKQQEFIIRDNKGVEQWLKFEGVWYHVPKKFRI